MRQFCKDCRWCRNIKDGEFAQCISPKQHWEDDKTKYVTGENIIRKPVNFCSHNRLGYPNTEGKLIEGLCGKDAKWFEPKRGKHA
jgi:hypothetical protein